MKRIVKCAVCGKTVAEDGHAYCSKKCFSKSKTMASSFMREVDVLMNQYRTKVWEPVEL